MKFIHTADLHLDAPIGKLAARAALRRDSLRVLEQMIAYGEQNNIEHFVIAGDLFDLPTPSSAILGAVTEMLGRSCLRFWIAPGNHDLWVGDKYAGADWPDNVHIFGKSVECITTPQGVIVGVGLYEGMTTHPLTALNVNTPISVGVFHGAVTENNPAYRINDEVLRQSGLGYAALGHIHKPAEPAYVGKTLVGISGSPLSHGFDELGERSFLQVELTEGGVYWKRVATDSIRFFEKEIEIQPELTASEVLGKLMSCAAEYREKDIFRFRLMGKTAVSIPSVLEEYPGLVEIIDQTTLPQSIEKMAVEQSLRGYFVRLMLDKLASAAPQERHKYEAALRLGLEAFE